ncbi:CPBP family intramembrane metalloprotease [Elizabethkingia bruuniana]|uniref:CPBP family intramembrane metalloprotease n=1 Tax=Elizabethkingia bruuniana TaxID=1756149 RepID=A0A7T7UXZ2_9FLAO|nr:type II CAAX endopeptidase family protein [Elizabethkingia bruuniana]KGO11576.1 CAAX protease [Elizabethkingia miricola]AQX84806.1 CAAX protease [Elizabethkingia bruuniana]KUY29011.1 CAAX protease [Elizabethkingia bruuniana]OPB70638.1 CAAX protease [Elizabethkingia bruuniana]QDZ62692.1 CPBP family intramembrane metalloprotease [Elizabethkingia bruuniana]
MDKDLHPGRNYQVGWKEGILLAVTFLFMQFVVAAWIQIQTIVFHSNPINENFFTLFFYILVFLGCIFAFDQLIVKPTGSRLSFNMRTSPFSTYLLIFPLITGGIFIAEYTTTLLPTTGSFWGTWYKQFTEIFEKLSLDPTTMIISTCFFAPILEEILFRGIIQKGLINKGISPVKAIIISAIVFGVVHGNPWQFMGAAILGSILGLVYYKTKTLLLPIMLHAFNNLMSSLLMIYTKEESYSGFFCISETNLLLIGIVLTAIFGYLFIYKNKIHYND